MAPTFSSTTGIQISMARFSQVLYDEQKELVKVDAGCLWDQVYSKLAPYNRNVIGGASSEGVGVGGWLLGGGYSLKSNRYGLGIDNVVQYEVVTPDGRVRKVTAKQEGKLFQALRVSMNLTRICKRLTVFTLSFDIHREEGTISASSLSLCSRLIPKDQPMYILFLSSVDRTYSFFIAQGGFFIVPGSRTKEVKAAIVDFVENEDRQEATLVAAFRHELKNGNVEVGILELCPEHC